MAEKKSGAIKIDWNKMEAQFSPNIQLTSKKHQANSNAEHMKETIIRFEIVSNKIENSECKTYSFEIDQIYENKPSNISNPWYFDFTGDEFITEGAKTPPRAPLKEKFQEKISKTNISMSSPKVEIDEDALVKPSSLFANNKIPVSEVKPTPQPSIMPPQKPLETKPTPQPSIMPPQKPLETKPTPQPSIMPPQKPSEPTQLFETLHKSSQEAAILKAGDSPSPELVDKSLPSLKQIEQLEDQLASTRNIIITLDKRLRAGLFNLPEYLEKKNFLIKKIENIKTELENLKKK